MAQVARTHASTHEKQLELINKGNWIIGITIGVLMLIIAPIIILQH